MSTTEPTDLDDALAVVRAISARIAVAAERGDSVALEKFTAQRRIASAEVDRLLSVGAHVGDVPDRNTSSPADYLLAQSSKSHHREGNQS